MLRRVLITGTTGFVGGALAARLKGESLVALVRAPTVPLARARLARSVSRFVPFEAASELAEDATVVLGDLAEERTFDHAAFDGVTHVVHCAASTSFRSKREVRRSNVVGTALLAARLNSAPRLSRFLHVSTAYCCADCPNRIVREDDSPRADHRYVNEYSRTKAEAELHLQAMTPGLPLMVARPSVVIGHTSLGVAPSASLFWYYRALAALGAGPFALEARRDIVPVDYVAEALEFLLFLEQPRFSTYHVSAGNTAAVSVEEIVAAFRGSPVARDWQTVSPSVLGTMADGLARCARTKEEARTLVIGLMECARFGALGVDAFDNSRLLSEGFRAPPRFTDYLGKCIASANGKTLYEQLMDDV
jgi:nucleoside-diphosphate-sugar epimerase